MTLARDSVRAKDEALAKLASLNRNSAYSGSSSAQLKMEEILSFSTEIEVLRKAKEIQKMEMTEKIRAAEEKTEALVSYIYRQRQAEKIRKKFFEWGWKKQIDGAKISMLKAMEAARLSKNMHAWKVSAIESRMESEEKEFRAKIEALEKKLMVEGAVRHKLAQGRNDSPILFFFLQRHAGLIETRNERDANIAAKENLERALGRAVDAASDAQNRLTQLAEEMRAMKEVCHCNRMSGCVKIRWFLHFDCKNQQ